MIGYILAFIGGCFLGWYLCERDHDEEFWTNVEDDDDFNDVM